MRKRRTNKIGKPVSIILVIITVLLFGLLYYFNMIPLKFILPITIVFGLFVFVLFCLIRKRTLKKGAFIVTIITILIEIILSYYLLVTLGFLNGIMAYDYKTHVYNVIVLKDSKYNKVQDLDGKTIGVYKEEKQQSEDQKALDQLKYKISFKKIDTDNLDGLFNNLFAYQIDAIFIEDSKYNILLDEEPSIRNKIKVIDTITVKTKLKVNKNDKTNVLKEPFNIYITGNDQYGRITNTGRSDVNLVATINVQEGKILFTSIPRDYYVSLAGKSGKDKLTHAGIYGVDSSIKTIENLLDTKINYYLKVNFTSVEKIVDVLGGIEVDSEYAFVSNDGYRYVKGINKLDGKKALSYVRERHAFDSLGGDRVRGEHQLQVIKILVDKITSEKILTKYQSLLKSVEGNFTTDFSEKNISKLVKYQLDKNIKWKVESYSLAGTDGRERTYSYPSKSLYVMIPDENSIKEAQNKIKEYFQKDQ